MSKFRKRFEELPQDYKGHFVNFHYIDDTDLWEWARQYAAHKTIEDAEKVLNGGKVRRGKTMSNVAIPWTTSQMISQIIFDYKTIVEQKTNGEVKLYAPAKRY